MPLTFVVLAAISFLGSYPAEGEGLQIEAESMQRKNLPDDFPFLVFNEGIAVLRVKINNNTDKEWTLDLEQLRVFASNDKEIERALPPEIAPKIMKYYRGRSLGIHGQGYYGYPYPPSQADMARRSTVGVATGPGKIDATLGQQLRQGLEYFELKTVTIPPGYEVEGYLYLKSKKYGNKLAGGRLEVGDGLAAGF